MRIGILGSGGVGRTLASGFALLGHEVMLGARTPDNVNAAEWQVETSGLIGSFAETAEFGEVVFNALKGDVALGALVYLKSALVDKVLVDLANPLDFSNGFPPSFTVSNTDSLGEQIQRELPDTYVVKALNTLNTPVAVAPGSLVEATDLFICGNSASAKETVVALLVELGWTPERIRDLGDITSARGTEAYLAIWVRLMPLLGTAKFNVRLVTE